MVAVWWLYGGCMVAVWWLYGSNFGGSVLGDHFVLIDT